MFTWKIETTVTHLFCLLQVPAGQSVTTSNISNSDTETEEPMEPECSTPNVVLAHSERKFQVHDIIAVAYEDDFYISEVMTVVSRDEIEISSMARYGTSFRWPTKPDTAITHRNFVLRANSELAPSKNNTIYSKLENYQEVVGEYHRYSEKYF